MENHGRKCTYYFGLGHTKKWCWKKNGRRLVATTNYLKVLVNDKKKSLIRLNQLCEMNNFIFWSARIRGKRNLTCIHEVGKNKEKPIKKGVKAQKKFGNEINITKFKILTHFSKCKTAFTPFEIILTIPRELEYLEGLLKLAKRHKDEKTQQSTNIATILKRYL
jgi:hypothetical protein